MSKQFNRLAELVEPRAAACMNYVCTPCKFRIVLWVCMVLLDALKRGCSLAMGSLACHTFVADGGCEDRAVLGLSASELQGLRRKQEVRFGTLCSGLLHARIPT